jgi:hypothetical protein
VLKPVDNELIPVEVDVDKLPTRLSVVLKPVDSELIPVEVDVDKLPTRLSVVLNPVDNELIPVEVDVDRLPILLSTVLRPVDSCTTVMASCGAAPSATLVIRRIAPAFPIDTSAFGAALFVRKPGPVGAVAPVTLPVPSATLFA